MPAKKNQVIFDVLANTKSYAQGMNSTKDITDATTKAMKYAFVALSAVAIGATVAFAKFEKGMSDISTIIDNSTEDIKGIGTEILNIGKVIPKPVSELVASMYDIRSAGVSAANAMGTLKSAGKLSVVGLSTTKEATDILTTSMNVFAKEQKSVTEISNILFKTVKYGKTTIAALSRSFGATIPLAQAAGASLVEVSAATSALTAFGIPASVAQTQLKAAMVETGRKSEKMSRIFKKLGYKDMKDLMNNSKDLGDAFKKIHQAALDLDMPMADFAGSTEATNAITLIATSGAEVYTRALKDMEGGVDAVDEAFKRQTATLNAQKQLILNMINSVFINIGSRLQPALISMGEGVMNFFQSVDNAITAHGSKITQAVNFISEVAMSVFSSMKDAGTAATNFFKAFGGVEILKVTAIALKLIVDLIGFFIKGILATSNAITNLISDLGIVGKILGIVMGGMLAIQAMSFASVIWGIITATKAWKVAMFFLNAIMSVNPIILIATAIVALGAVIYDIIVNFNEWRLSFDKLINSVIIGWNKAKALFAGEETKKALEAENVELEKQNAAINAQTEALKKRKEELKAKGVSSFEADRQAGQELDEGKIPLDQLKTQEEQKTNIKKKGEEDRAEVDRAAKEESYAKNEKYYNDEKSRAESKFNEDMVKAKDDEDAKIEAKQSYQERLKELDAQHREENLAIDDERKILDEEREIEFQQLQLDRRIESGITEREAANQIKKEELDQKTKLEKDYQINKQKRGIVYAKAKLVTDKFYANQAVKSFDENSQHLTKMADSKNKTLAGIGKAAAIAKIAIDTPRAAMGAYSALAAIPIIGPALGVAAAAAAIAYGAEQISRVKSSSYAVGTDMVPRNMTANIHKGEGIIPAKENQFLQSGKLALVSPDVVTNNDNSTGQTVNNYNTEVSFADANIYGDVDDNMSIKIADNIATQINEDRFAGFPAPSVQTS